MRYPGMDVDKSVRGAGLVWALLVVFGLVILAVATAVVFFEGRKMYWDSKVREMCQVDGGVQIFEAVKLPRHKYKELEDRNFMLPKKKEAKPSDEYYFTSDVIYYKTANPQVARTQYRIVQRAGEKILGQLVFYGRGGGDIPGPWHESSYTCPDPATVSFESSILLRGAENGTD